MLVKWIRRNVQHHKLHFLKHITGKSGKATAYRVLEGGDIPPVERQEILLDSSTVTWETSKPGIYKLFYFDGDSPKTEYWIVDRGDTPEDGLFAAQCDLSEVMLRLEREKNAKYEAKRARRSQRIADRLGESLSKDKHSQSKMR